jgi:hypothetical protein
MSSPLIVLLALFTGCLAVRAADDHFEKHDRPLLAEKCQSCHGAEKTKGGLRLDSRPGTRLSEADARPNSSP